MPSHYLEGWLQEHGLSTSESIRSALQKRSLVEDLRSLALEKVEYIEPLSEYSVVAGAGLDFSGTFDCSSPACIEANVNTLFRHVWHYFDTIVLADSATAALNEADGDLNEDQRESIQHQADALLAIRRMGAAELVQFRPKSPPLDSLDRAELERARLGYLMDKKEEIVSKFVELAEFTIRKEDNEDIVEFTHPRYPLRISFYLSAEDLKFGVEEIYRAAARNFLEDQIAYLAGDVLSANLCRASLGAGAPLTGDLLRLGAADRVAFHFELPTLKSIPTEILIKLRQDERDAFLRFRKALRVAAEERLKLGNDSSMQRINAQIQSDLVEPEIEKIRGVLKRAQKLAALKSVAGVALGGLVTTCGLLAGLPPPASAAAGLTTAAGVSGAAISARMDKLHEIAQNDMYFIWKALHAD